MSSPVLIPPATSIGTFPAAAKTRLLIIPCRLRAMIPAHQTIPMQLRSLFLENSFVRHCFLERSWLCVFSQLWGICINHVLVHLPHSIFFFPDHQRFSNQGICPIAQSPFFSIQ